MNIFYLHHDPKQCAQMHVDKHVVKMILEYAQLLSTTHRLLDGKVMQVPSNSGRLVKRWVLPDSREAVLYSATHINHPSAQWVRQDGTHYRWLYELFVCLLDEYSYRYGKHHATGRLANELAQLPHHLACKDFVEPTLAMPDAFKIENDAVLSYRNYYQGAKSHLLKWTKRPVPEWIEELKEL